jgi:hypothetical protein
VERRTGNIHNSIPSVQALDRLAALMSAELERSPEPHTASSGPLPAFAGPGLDERPFEFGEASEDRQHQHPMRRGGVAPSILERADSCAGLLPGHISVYTGRPSRFINRFVLVSVTRAPPYERPSGILVSRSSQSP